MSRARDLADSADLNFDSGTLVIDSANNRVGIGTSSPLRDLHVSNGGAEGYEFGAGEAANKNQTLHYNRSTSQYIENSNRASQHTWDVNTSEAARIDSSGNLLVGKTSSGTQNTADGFELRNAGFFFATVSNDAVAYFNRRTSDGDIAVFRKDGTTVGSIGVDGGDNLYLTGQSGNSGGIYMNDAAVSPAYQGVERDNYYNLGKSGARWKDLYLSGGVYVGGTGAANYLDDYEEGDWTPTLSCTGGNTGITYGYRVGKYVKVGDIVTCNGYIELTSDGTASGDCRVSGWPFTPINVTQMKQTGTVFLNNTVSTSNFDGNFNINGEFNPNDATFRIYALVGSGVVSQFNASDLQSNTSIRVSVTYRV